MEALVIQELDSSSSIVWYFSHNNYQSATRSMNEWEHCLRSIGILCVTMVANSSRHAFSRGVSPTNREFHLLLCEEVNHKQWRQVQVPLARSVCVVVCTEARTPGCNVRNNQTFIEVSTGRSHRIVTWVDDTDFEFYYIIINALQQYMDYTSL